MTKVTPSTGIDALIQELNELRAALGRDPVSLANGRKMGKSKMTTAIEGFRARLRTQQETDVPDPLSPAEVAAAVDLMVATEQEPAAALPDEETISHLMAQYSVPASVFEEGLTIKATSERLLTHVVRTDQSDNRTVGVPYQVVLKLVRNHFPGCRTTIACLRWYALQIRELGLMRLPQKRLRPTYRRSAPLYK